MTECSAAGLARCAFAADSVAATTTKWNTILDRLGRGPLPFTDPDGVTQEMPDVPRLVTSVADDLYAVWPGSGFPGWVGVAQRLQRLFEAATGNGRGAQPGRPAPPDSTPPADPTYVGQEGLNGILCDAAPADPTRLPMLVAETQKQTGLFGLYGLFFDVFCMEWGIPPADSYTGPFNVTLTHPPLIVNNSHDPSTVMGNADAMHDAFPGSARLRISGYGHTALLNRSSCAKDYITDYLINGGLPADDTWCDQDARPFDPLPE